MVDTSIVEKIINSKKLNYNKMNELVKPYFETGDFSNKRNVTIYIDINNVVKQLYSKQMTETFSHIKTNNRMNVIVEIINIIGHYRHFFASRLKMHTRFFLFYSEKKSKYHLNVDPAYKKEQYKKYDKENIQYRDIHKTIESCIELCKIIINYIPNTYFIDTMSFESTILPYYIMEKTYLDNKDDYSLIISNDKIFRQLLKYKDRLIILELRGVKGSKVISKENLKEEFLPKNSKQNIENFANINYNIIDIYNLLTEHKEQGYKGVPTFGPTTILKKMEKLIETNKFSPLKDYNNEIIIEKLFKDEVKEEILDEIIKRYKLFNFEKVVNEIDGNNIKKLIHIQINDFNDPKEIRKLNEQVFENSYINIDYLFEGEINR